MSLVALPGSPVSYIGATSFITTTPNTTATVIDAANEALIYIGHIRTSDGGSHTIDTTGSSSLGWRSGTLTFANAGTTVKVGLAAVDTTAGPPGRAANTTDAINFDVSADFTGGGGGITASAWQTSVPTTGTKTIADGALVAFAVQMTARGGADSVRPTVLTGMSLGLLRPTVTAFTGAAYSEPNNLPNLFITFSDGAFGWFEHGDVISTITATAFASGSSPNERGQLFNLPFPCKIYGIYGNVIASADFDVVLYSDALGTPAAEKTVSIDANTVSVNTARRFVASFAPYTYAANANIAAVIKPGASNVTVYHKTLASATHRVTDPWGTSGYGVNRSSGAFGNQNSSLDHYYLGLIVGAFDNGVSTAPVGGQRVIQNIGTY